MVHCIHPETFCIRDLKKNCKICARNVQWFKGGNLLSKTQKNLWHPSFHNPNDALGCYHAACTRPARAISPHFEEKKGKKHLFDQFSLAVAMTYIINQLCKRKKLFKILPVEANYTYIIALLVQFLHELQTFSDISIKILTYMFYFELIYC